MISLSTQLRLDGVTGGEITDFMLNCTDAQYQRWWPGTHLAFHTIKRRPNDLGNLVYIDEYVGKRRLKGKAVIKRVEPGRRIVWQLVKLLRLPVRVQIELEDEPGGVLLVHTVTAGFKGWARVFDPLFRVFLSAKFAVALDEHVRAEFPLLRDLLIAERRA